MLMTPPLNSPILGRVAVFTFENGNTVAHLTAPFDVEREAVVSSMPGFSHWGTDTFIIDVIPYPTLGEAA